MPPKKTSAAASAKKAAPATAAKPAKPSPAKPEPVAAAPSAKANGKKRAAAADSAPAKPTPTKKAKAPKVAAAPVSEEEDEEEDAGAENERSILASLSDVSADSSADEEEDDEEEDEGPNSSDEDDEDDRLAAAPRSSMASMKLPNSKDDSVVRARLDKLRKVKTASGTSSTPGVLYIGRLPKGFFEKQLRSYLSQFGEVTRLRVSRNKKTGASKHYAFVEFADKDVAAIVQETMHNYLIDGRLLQVKTVSKDKVHPELWIGANRKFKRVPTDRIERVVRSREKSDDEQRRTNDRAMTRQHQRRTRLAHLGIDYDFPGYTNDDATKPKSAPAKKQKSSKA